MKTFALVYKGKKPRLILDFPGKGRINLEREKIYKLRDYQILKDPEVYIELTQKYFCIPIEKVKEASFKIPIVKSYGLKIQKNVMVRRTFAIGDIVMVHALMQSRPHIHYYWVTNTACSPIITADNITIIDEKRYGRFLDDCDSFVDMDVISSVDKYTDCFNFVELFNKMMGFKKMPQHMNWEIKYTYQDMQFVKTIASDYLKYPKRLYLQYNGSGSMKSLHAHAIHRFIHRVVEDGWAVAVMHHKHQYDVPQHPMIFNFTGRTQLQHIVPMMEISTAIYSMDSSPCMLANCTKNSKDQYLFVVTGPNIGYPKAGYHPNGHHINMAHRFEVESGKTCFPCYESTERCGMERVAKCLLSATGDEIADEFLKGYEEKMIKKSQYREKFWSSKEMAKKEYQNRYTYTGGVRTVKR